MKYITGSWSLVITLFLLMAGPVKTIKALDEPHNYYAQWGNGPLADSTFFPILITAQAPAFSGQYKALGINTFLGLPDGATAAELVTLRTYGMKTICQQSTDALAWMDMLDTVILGWTQADEPDIAQWNGDGYDPCIATSEIINRYNTMKAADATRPIYINFGPGVADIEWIGRGTCTGQWRMYSEYIQGADIVSYDIYPVCSGYDLWYVPKGIDSLRSWCDDEKPVMCWIECVKISASHPQPTPAQVKTEVWMSLIHGANMIGYFGHEFDAEGNSNPQALLADAQMMRAVTAINEQITNLAPVLNSPTVTGRVSVQSSNSGVPIDIMVKEYQGGLYIFAVAMRPGATGATFTVDDPSEDLVAVINEERELEITDNVFSDAFTSYGVHLYQLGGSSTVITDRAAKSPATNRKILSAFPNPATERIIIHGAQSRKARLYTMDGVFITEEEIEDGGFIRWSDNKNIPGGVYLLELDGEGIRKIVVTKR